MDLLVEKLRSNSCSIDGWKETDNCLDCKFFGGLYIYQQDRLKISIRCNHGSRKQRTTSRH